MKVSIHLLSQDAKLPTYGSQQSAGIDLYAPINDPVDLI